MSHDEASAELLVHRGAHYIDCIGQLARLTRAGSYFEIGTDTGASLARIDCAAVAVDPSFKMQMDVMGTKPACHLYQMTSDAFFAAHDPRTLFGRSIDLAFLDGMHHFEFLLRDFMNTERLCTPDSVILLHDCLPMTFEMSTRNDKAVMRNPAYPRMWTGDVWKTAAILKICRPDLRLIFLDAAPTGLVLCTRLDPASTVLKDRYAEMVAEFAPRGDDIRRLKDFLGSITISPTSGLQDRRSWKALVAG
jgi:hypothetical protein